MIFRVFESREEILYYIRRITVTSYMASVSGDDATRHVDELKRLRRPQRALLVKRMNELDHELSKGEPDKTLLQVKLDMMRNTFDKVDALDQQIVTVLATSGSDDEVDAEIGAIADYEERYRVVKVKTENCLEGSDARSSSSDDASTRSRPTNSTNRKQYKLPKIQLKKFDGELKNWLGFWSQFSKIHEDASLHDTDKFQYLVQSMEGGTEPEELVNSYPLTAANYPKAVAALRERYGRDSLLLQVYIRELLKLVISNVNQKDKLPLDRMYLKLESHLRALNALNLTQADPATWLFPLVESSLPEDVLRAWQRSPMSKPDDATSGKNCLDVLMDFVKLEVQNEQQIILARTGFHSEGDDTKRAMLKKVTKKPVEDKLPTAAGLQATSKVLCIFCDKGHASKECLKARSLSLEQKKEKIKEKGLCFLCLKAGHLAKNCRPTLKCVICLKRHCELMCPQIHGHKDVGNRGHVESTRDYAGHEAAQDTHSHLNCTNEVILQTLRVDVVNGKKRRTVRALLDSGSQRSYILKRTVQELNLASTGEIRLRHLLFGGSDEERLHKEYTVHVQSPAYVRGNETIVLQVLDQQQICGQIPQMKRGVWMQELKQKSIYVADLGDDSDEVELLIGADYYGHITTGRIHQLSMGLTAIETRLGWTISGRCDQNSVKDSSVAMNVVSMYVSDAIISQLWDLEAIGIHDEIQRKAREERELEAKNHFLQTVTRTENGRYSVSLPWIYEGTEIPNNRLIAERRLLNMTTKLQSQGKFMDYQNVFDTWLAEDLIEVVTDDRKQQCHYLPHRAVFKSESLTTPVRPVFDASCKVGRTPSLNDLLEKGPNLLELLPKVLLRFRQYGIGVIADIRKAFQMIEVDERDRDYLRFLWWEDFQTRKLVAYRHKRVVFGVNCSPFLLSAVLELHLKSVDGEHSLIADKLLKSLYVDNCTTSVSSWDEYDQFKKFATEIMVEANMDLRNWECTQPSSGEFDCDVENMNDTEQPDPITRVLGIVWNKAEDSLSCEVPVTESSEVVTKRDILSYLGKFFDPVGLLSPALLSLRLILQAAHLVKTSWDEPLPESARVKLQQWHAAALCLKSVKIDRCISHGGYIQQMELHTFCDASQVAYAAVVFLRSTDSTGRVTVRLLMAKARVAPINKSTIPRLELLACVIGARLCDFVSDALSLCNVPRFYWSDSTTALAWIKRNNEWGTFVGNRVKEVCSLTSVGEWRHVPGVNNPADLPSRGCSPVELLQCKWWEGPPWLCESKELWPYEEDHVDEAAVSAEQKGVTGQSSKSVAVLMSSVSADGDTHPWYLTSSTYVRTIRVIACMRRFIHNCKQKHGKRDGILSIPEFLDAEMFLMRLVQQEEFPASGHIIRGLVVEKASDALYHVKTRLTVRDDVGCFHFPVLLPSRHPVVTLLITWYHVKYQHAGAQFLMSKLRERYWILQSRKAISRVIHKCTVCLRHSGRSFTVDPATLPTNRTDAVCAFQTTGVDLAGPLYLKSGEKAWLVLFTCAVYRCVHLDFVTSQSTEAFLSALERFISIRGRPGVIYSDNGTNFVGTVNLFRKLNWTVVQETAHVKQIQWIFNPPSAAWWGGWWERMIRTVKDLLKRMIGNARLNYDQLRTALSSVENVINERPLTVVTEDTDDLIPITPAMFMRSIQSALFPEASVTAPDLREEYRRGQELQQELKSRFRIEYLSLLVQRAKESKHRHPKVGDVVLVGTDDKRRLLWPLAKIIELIPGRDGALRLAKVKTQHGVLLRPLQRLYPLEMSEADEAHRITYSLPKSCPVEVMACEHSDIGQSVPVTRMAVM